MSTRTAGTWVNVRSDFQHLHSGLCQRERSLSHVPCDEVESDDASIECESPVPKPCETTCIDELSVRIAPFDFDGAAYGLDYVSFNIEQRIALLPLSKPEEGEGWAQGAVVLCWDCPELRYGWFPEQWWLAATEYVRWSTEDMECGAHCLMLPEIGFLFLLSPASPVLITHDFANASDRQTLGAVLTLVSQACEQKVHTCRFRPWVVN